MSFRRRVVVIVLLAAQAWTGAAIATCAGGTQLPPFANKQILLADDVLFFSTGDLQLDIDGSPRAYGKRDQGMENICNGLAPLEPPRCRGNVTGACYAACQAAFRGWNGDLATLGDSMCSIGLGGGNCSVPAARLQDPPNQDWFVSETSVHVAPPAAASLSAWIATQPAQLDSTAVPYFVIPAGFRRLPWDATPGDVGVVVSPSSARTARFVIGDIGGALNEGSAALLARLTGLDRLPTAAKTNAFGVTVDRLQGASDGDFRVAIFRHTTLVPDHGAEHDTLVMAKSAAELPAWIDATVTARLAEIGGADRVVECTEP